MLNNSEQILDISVRHSARQKSWYILKDTWMLNYLQRELIQIVLMSVIHWFEDKIQH